jgi:hypothetical protein
MLKKKLVAIGAVFAFAVATGGMAFAQSKCDSGITKAAGKKCACKASVIAKAQGKGTAPDPAKLAKCEAKFDKACQKAVARGDCIVQLGSCAAMEATVDACVATLGSSASPSGAFLE